MVNIKVQCCGIALLAMLSVVYGRRKKLDLISGKIFRIAYSATIFCLCMDILSIVMIVRGEKFLAFLTRLVCKTYLAALVLVGFTALIYVGSGICCRLPAFKRHLGIYAAVTAGIIILIYCLPILTYASPGGDIVYSYGPSTWMTYIGALFLIMANLVVLVTQRERIYERQRRAVIIWMCMWIMAALIQFIDGRLLVVGYACALGIAIIYFQFENPELNLDRNTGLFNYMAFMRYVEELYGSHAKFYVVTAVYENIFQQNLEIKQEVKGISKVADIFLEIPAANAFKILEDEVLLVFRGKEKADAAWADFQEKTAKGKREYGRLSFFYIENPRCVDSAEGLLELAHYVRNQRKDLQAGNFVVVDESMPERMLSERRMTEQIREALEENRILVYYQPIYSIKEKRFTSAEALVRICGRDGSIIPPTAFIDLAENNGMISDIGRQVFEKVCSFFVENNLEKYGINYIEVNLSVVQCADDKLAEDYIRIMNRCGIEPGRINLEITESAALCAKKGLIANMERLIGEGVHFSLDDFGTGHSNLNYIVDMPVQIVKFDRGMIQAYFNNEKAKYVMDAAMHMIQGLELEIVAEGIETREQCQVMEDIKINFIQGYHFSGPLPEQEFLAFINRRGALCG